MSRKEIHKLIKNGCVRLNGAAVKDPSTPVDTQKDGISVMGKPLVYEEFIYIMMDKPAGVLSASNDKKRKTVLDLLPDELRRRELFPAGRLDIDTTGFILITNDGDFAHHILSPKNHVKKEYTAKLERDVTKEDAELFARGITLADGTKLMPAILKKTGECEADITICEGKFHQIKKMFAATGNAVLSLRRTAIGALRLDETLGEGNARKITPDELALIEKGQI